MTLHSRRGFTRSVLIAGTGLIVAVLAALGLHLVRERADTLARAERNNTNLVHVLVEQTAQTVHAIDLTLLTVVEALTYGRIRGGAESPDGHDFLRHTIAVSPFIWALLVTDARGVATYSSASFPVTPVDFSDRDYFTRHRDDPALGLHVGAPKMSRPVGGQTPSRWFIGVSRRVTTSDGRFAGVVVAAVDPQYFRALYDGLAVGREGSVAMFLRDGTLMARSPHLEPLVGQSFADRPFFRTHLPAAAAGSLRPDAGLDDVARLVSYRAVPGLPLVMVVTRSQAEILEGWRRGVAVDTIATLVLVGMIATLTAVLARHVGKLIESEDRFRSLFEHSPDAVVVVAEHGALLDANAAAGRLFGATEASRHGRAGLVHLDAADGAVAAMLDEHERTGHVRGELTLRRADGTTFPADVRMNGFVDRHGAKRTAMIVRDVGDQKRLEAQVRLQAAALEAAANAIVITDRDGTIVWTNPATTAITGYPADELRGQNPRIFKSGRQSAEVYEDLWRTVTGGRAWHGCLINRRKDGSLYQEEQTITPVLDARGEITHLVAIKQDVSERLHAEQELGRQRELARQQERLAEMGRLLAGVAHELNNPLAVVLAHANLLEHKAPDPAVAARAAKMREAAERCARIVKNFLALARQYPPETRSVALNTLVCETIEMLGYQLRVENIVVALDLADDVPELAADPHQLQQVLVNLVVNAAHALRSTASRRQLTLGTRYDARNARVVLEVRDTGPGIAAGVRARLFEPFVTTKPVGEGTGLGLSICKGIVESHGGTISADSVDGRGATFTIALPVRPAPAAPVSAAPAPAVAANLRVLVVDDESAVAGVLAEMVARRASRVDTAGNGVAALARLHAHEYDVIFCDLKMPVMDGEALYTALVRERGDVASRVIFMTGDTFSPATHAFLSSTGRPLLSKPFSEADVWNAVEALAPR